MEGNASPYIDYKGKSSPQVRITHILVIRFNFRGSINLSNTRVISDSRMQRITAIPCFHLLELEDTFISA